MEIQIYVISFLLATCMWQTGNSDNNSTDLTTSDSSSTTAGLQPESSSDTTSATTAGTTVSNRPTGTTPDSGSATLTGYKMFTWFIPGFIFCQILMKMVVG